MLYTAKLKHGLRHWTIAMARALLLDWSPMGVKAGCLGSDLLAGGGSKASRVWSWVLQMRPGVRRGQLRAGPGLAALGVALLACLLFWGCPRGCVWRRKLWTARVL